MGHWVLEFYKEQNTNRIAYWFKSKPYDCHFIPFRTNQEREFAWKELLYNLSL